MLLHITLPNGQHETLNLEQTVQSGCMRKLFERLGSCRPGLAGELICYLALFRPRVHELRESRLLALADQVFDLADRHGEQRLTDALGAVLDTLLPRSRQSDWQPLRGHRYLEETLKRLPATPIAAPGAPGTRAPSSRTAAAIQSMLED